MKTDKAHSLTSNIILNALLTASSIIYPLITVPYVSRILGPEGTGAVSFASSIVSYFVIFAQLGIPIYGIRACAKVQEDKILLSKTLAELLTINLISCTISYVCFFIAMIWIPRLNESKEIFLIFSISIILNSLGAEWLYKALEQYQYITIRSIFFKVFSIAFIFLMVKSTEDTIYYALGTVLALYGSYIVNFINLRKYISCDVWKHLDIRQHLHPTLVFFAMSVSTTIYTHLDSSMLGFLKTDIDVGYYSMATNVKTLLISFIASLGTVLLPRASLYLEKDMVHEFYRLAQKALYFVVLAATPLTIYFILFAKESIYFLSGPQFTGSIIPMMVIMPAVLLVGLTNIMGIQILIPLGKESNVMFSTLLGAIVNLILNYIWIPNYGATGASLSTVIAELIVFLFQLYSLRTLLVYIVPKLHCFRIFGSLSISCLLSLFLKRGGYNAFPLLLLSSTVFFGSYFFLLFLLREPFLIDMKKRWKKK